MKRITIVSPSLKIGGIERALSVLADFFANEGYNIDFICCLKSSHFYKLHKNINIIEPNFARQNGYINKLLFYPRLVLFLRKKIKFLNPDSVLVYGDWFSPLVLLATYGIDIPVFISDRTSADYAFKFPIPQLKKLLYPKSSGFIAQTERAKSYREKEFGDKLNIEVIPNAIREVKCYPKIEREKTILFLGRFAWEKDPEILIRAFAKLSDAEEWILVMAGSGPLLSKMKDLTDGLDVNNRVKFLGQIKDVDIELAKSSICVLPSVLEGFPNTLCEAMASGLPVVCFHTIPYEHIVKHGYNGIVVNPRDSETLAIELDKLIANKDRRKKLGDQALQIREQLDVKRIGNRVLKFILTKN